MKILALICILGGLAWGQTPWRLTTADLVTQSVDLRRMDSAGVDYVDAESKPHHVAADQFVEIRRASSAQAASAGWMVLLEDGERLAGTAVGMKGDELAWRTPLLGECSVHLPEATHILRADASVLPVISNDEDVVHLANGDAVHGAIFGMTDQQVSLQAASGPANISWAGIAQIDFARLPGAAAATQAAARWRVSLEDGTVLRVPNITWAGDAIHITAAGRSCEVPIAQVTAIEQMNGPVLFLAGEPLVENVQIPLMGAPWAARVGFDLDGMPDANAISVHAYSRLTWAVPAGFARFHVQYAVPGELSLADVRLRILMDGKMVYEQTHVHGGAVSPVIEVPMKGGGRVTLEVDTENPYRTQGWVMWMAPALVR